MNEDDDLVKALIAGARDIQRNDPERWAKIPLRHPKHSVSLMDTVCIAAKQYDQDDPALRDLPYIVRVNPANGWRLARIDRQ